MCNGTDLVSVHYSKALVLKMNIVVSFAQLLAPVSRWRTAYVSLMLLAFIFIIFFFNDPLETKISENVLDRSSPPNFQDMYIIILVNMLNLTSFPRSLKERCYGNRFWG